MLVLLTLALIPIAYTDFKYRNVYLWAILAYMAVALGFFFVQRPITPTEFAISYILVAAVTIASVSFTYLRLRKRLNVKDIAGSGDLLFFAAIPLLLPIKQLLVYLIATCIAGLLHYLVVQKFCSRKITIPLAGWGAVCLASFMIIQRVW
ncbi:prepilin peptidase [uncultured Acetobacteroides sp.]|uniref:prepilin peptidase n=1 Tax=uncultured Acetobacteroides sp. TaxID=1760811 RepID=UPI0029F546FA|nr:prepilin peptidase [uncultured Acetobacteroides sp.]